MSELSINVAPPPELLKTAAAGSPPATPGRAPDGAGAAAGAPNAFAALLSGFLQGAQPLPQGPAPGAGAPTDAQLPDTPLQPDPGAAGTTMLALPGAAMALPAGNDARATGNLLPATGNELPLVPAGPRPDTDTPSGLQAQDPPGDTASTPPAASRPRIFLADLALSRPLEPAATPSAAAPGPGAAEAGRMAATAAALAERTLSSGNSTGGETPARSTGPTRGSGPAGSSPTVLQPAALAIAVPAGDLPAGSALAGTDGLVLRSAAAEQLVRGAGLAGTGTEFLAGQLAAFAAGSDGDTGRGLPAVTSSGGSGSDTGSAALLGRLGSTGLPPLQPQGDAGAFAGGLADRLLTLGGPGAHSARLKLHPESLGELDVEITMDDGTAQVWFGTTTSQARDAIEGSLPRLRDLFAEQGIQLTRTQVDVGGGQAGNPGFGQERRMTGGAGAWSDAPAWRQGRPGGGAETAGRTADTLPARLLDVWA
ncbi:MAG: flagellar hook-length control protein FliK [Gammaproteobacteria bacterium]|nr:flagellar hook-length control protein FliK [Gammaproteobacteria bacterium]